MFCLSAGVIAFACTTVTHMGQPVLANMLLAVAAFGPVAGLVFHKRLPPRERRKWVAPVIWIWLACSGTATLPADVCVLHILLAKMPYKDMVMI